MTKSELIYEVARQAKLPKVQVERIINALFGVIGRELNHGNKVQITGFGSFDVRTRDARKGTHPRTGETIDLPETKRPHFTPGEVLKRAVN